MSLLFSRHIQERRRLLKKDLMAVDQPGIWDESCLPSYAHPNVLAAWVAWRRLVAAAAAFQKWGGGTPVLDFGSSSGELFPFLGINGEDYHFVEHDPRLAGLLAAAIPRAVPQALSHLPPRRYAAVFALDSLEHNLDFESLCRCLLNSLAPGGVLVVSGPTENALYRWGRRIAGFSGHYHRTNIHTIEVVLKKLGKRLMRRAVPFGVPLFQLSVWSLPTGAPLVQGDQA